MPKISAKFDGSPQEGRQMGWVKVGCVKPVSRYILETAQDRDIIVEG